MSMPLPEATPAIGHNNAPSDAAVLHERLREKEADLLNRQQDLLLAVDRTPEVCEDDETAGKISDMIKMITHCGKSLEGARVAEKEPYLSLGSLVDGFFKKYTDALDKGKAKVNKVLTVYIRRKEDEARAAARIEEERKRAEAQRLADEAAAQEAAQMPEAAAATFSHAAAVEKEAQQAGKLADAKPADLSRTRGDYGSVASLRTRWVGEITDAAQLDLDALREFIPLEALRQAVNNWARTKRLPLRGALIHEISETVVR